jgi:hypothetical protein
VNVKLEGRIESEIIRVVLGHAPEPQVDLFLLAKRLGVDNFRATCFPDGFTDFRAHEPVIFLNRSESGSRMRFILAHELAHVMFQMRPVQDILGVFRQAGLVDSEEELADHVGAAILLPDSWVEVLRKAHCTLRGLEQVAGLADIPLMALIRRLSRAQIDVGMLHWQGADGHWHLIDRAGVPSHLNGDFRISEAARRRFENLSDKESTVPINGLVNGRAIAISGSARKFNNEIFQLIRPSVDIWTSAENSLSDGVSPEHVQSLLNARAARTGGRATPSRVPRVRGGGPDREVQAGPVSHRYGAQSISEDREQPSAIDSSSSSSQDGNRERW